MPTNNPADIALMEKYKNYEAISRGKREWEATFDAVSDLILIVNPDHTISRANLAMARRCGLTPQELPGRKCYEVFHKTEKPPDSCPFKKLMQERSERGMEIEECALGGFFEITASPLYENGEIVACVHVARDITERKRMEAERLAMEQKLQQAQKLESLGVLAGGIAHDFNNILMIILGHCLLAKQESDPESWERGRLKQIEIAGKRAGDLCRQLLAYVGKSPLVKSRVSLGAMVAEIAALLKAGIKKNVTLQEDLAADLPEVMGDRAQIQQILMNLIVNAVEAIGEKRGTVRIGLAGCEVGPEGDEVDFFRNVIPPGSYVRLDVADTGCGMAPQTQQRIFEPFFTTKFTGRGLGLSAMIGILTSHKGALQLASQPGEGTTFRVYFPASAAAEEPETPPPAKQEACGPSQPAPGDKGTVLLVDDEDEVRRIGADLLWRMGYITITARNGREAVDIYRGRAPSIDLILMDLTMPVMDGIEAYEEIRKECSTVPVVICSGYGKHELSSYISNDRYAGVMPKPYNGTQLHEVLARLLKSEQNPTSA